MLVSGDCGERVDPSRGDNYSVSQKKFSLLAFLGKLFSELLLLELTIV